MNTIKDVLYGQYNIEVVFIVEYNYQKFKNHLHFNQSLHLWTFSCLLTDIMVNQQLEPIEIIYVDTDYLKSYNTLIFVIPNRYSESSVFEDLDLFYDENSAKAPKE